MENEKTKIFDLTTLFTSLVCIAPLFLGIIMWNKFPEQVPIHFNASGQPDNYGPKWVNLILYPVLMTLMNLFMNFVLNLKARKNGADTKNIMNYILKWFFPVITLVVCFIIFSYSLGLKIKVVLIVSVVISLFYIIMGNYFPKAEKWMFNIPIKEENLTKVKRCLGWSFTITGLLCFVFSFTSFGIWVLVGLTTVQTIYTVYVAVKAEQ